MTTIQRDNYKRENALCYITHWAFQVALVVKNPPANAGDIRDVDLTLGREDPLEEGMATHTSILAWRIPWTEEPGGLQPIGPQSRTQLKRLSTHTHTTHTHKYGTQNCGV